MLLGIGPDAHICSLFPGDDALAGANGAWWAWRRRGWRRWCRGSRSRCRW